MIKKDICLVQLPISDIFQPNIALSILKGDVERNHLSSVIDYANLRFIRMTGIKKYQILQNWYVFLMEGEVLFSESAGFRQPGNTEAYFQWVKEFCKQYAGNHEAAYKVIKEAFYAAKQCVDRFISETAECLLAYSPKIVACSLVYQQNNAAFALCNKIKEMDAGVITLLGGSQCAAEAGVAISKNIPGVDYVFSGEADTVFGTLCEALIRDGKASAVEKLPYGTIKNGTYSGDSPPYALTLDMDQIPVPDYDDYFADLKKYELEEDVKPGLLIEGSRGCWWGEKEPCTFCGLGGFTRKYRVKKASAVLRELDIQYKRYKINRFTFTDSIFLRVANSRIYHISALYMVF
jgi:magnesium-protoporphyrin IX monomethyl ester (oxidative) cyclase